MAFKINLSAGGTAEGHLLRASIDPQLSTPDRIVLDILGEESLITAIPVVQRVYKWKEPGSNDWRYKAEVVLVQHIEPHEA